MEKLFAGCEKVLTYCAVICVFFLMCLTTADVILRTFFNMPIPGAYEFSEQYLLVASGFLGMWYAYRRGAFIRVTVLVDRLPRLAKLTVEYAVLLFSIVVNLFFVIATFRQFLRAVVSGTRIPSWHLPTWPAYLLIPIALLLTCLPMILDLTKIRRGTADLLKEELEIVKTAVPDQERG